ncbi:acylneuraminate cytidylyltransferase [Hymenobacter sp. BT18]|nr:acylneuraminate cytidylyltransferase [Hymenobacter sp. BT18]
MTSTRLPGKVLQLIGQRPMLAYHLTRLHESNETVYLATTENQTDDILVDYAISHNIPYIRGSESDVLSRYYACARAYGLDIIVRVTSDCPLIDGELIQAGIQEYKQAADHRLYLSNVLTRTFPRGLDFEIFSRELLEEAFLHAKLPADREHVTPYIHQNRSGKVNFRHVTHPDDRSQYRLTVDTAEDFRLMKILIEEYGADKLGVNKVISLLDNHPELVAINAHIEQKKL